MLELKNLEEDVLRMLLDGDDPALAVLREQLSRCTVSNRKMTGVGFVTELRVAEDAPRLQTAGPGSRVGDVVADLPGVKHGAGFVLFIRDGKLDNLEGYTFGEPWPDVVSSYDLRYIADERDLSTLST